ncbi:MAG: hypothetical protein KDK70_05915 [Myxococcales bacterium]|nr:hypothetical protein [Myxococcales bacterium]
MSVLFRVEILALRTTGSTTTVELRADQIHPEGTDLSELSAGEPPPDLPFTTRLVGRMLADAARPNPLDARLEAQSRDDAALSFIERIEVLEDRFVCIADYLAAEHQPILDELVSRFDLDRDEHRVLRLLDELRGMDREQREAFASQHSLDLRYTEDDSLDYLADGVARRSYELWRCSVTLAVSLPSAYATHLGWGMIWETSAHGG